MQHTLLALEALIDSNLTVLAFETTAAWSANVCLSTCQMVHHHLVRRLENAPRVRLITKSVLIQVFRRSTCIFHRAYEELLTNFPWSFHSQSLMIQAQMVMRIPMMNCLLVAVIPF